MKPPLKSTITDLELKDENVDKALEAASWKLNEGGYRLYFQELKAAIFKKENMKLDGNIITETYIGKKTKSYVGHYETDGNKCNCSWFQSRLLCRHPFFFRMANNMPLFDISIFHPSFKVIEDVTDNNVNESVDMFDMSGNVNSRLGSPGMEYLIAEEQETNKKMKKNEKYNKAFDVAKVAAEYLSMYSKAKFLENLESFKHFTELLRTGIPEEVAALLKKHSEHNNDNTDEEMAQVTTKKAEMLPRQSFVKEICDEHKHLIPEDHAIYPVPGDGSCLFGALAAHVYKDELQASNLRRLCHYYIVDNWWYFQHYLPMPFIETVGVGAESYRVCIDNHEELKNFLLSDTSLKCYSNSQVDFSALCNLFKMNIGIFTYGLGNLPPRWTWISPDPLLTEYSTTNPPFLDPLPNALLYHHDEVHYELLVHKSSYLAMHGNVSVRLARIGAVDDEAELVLDVVELEEAPEDDDLPDLPGSLARNEVPASFISPLVFKHCPKGRGRPKKGREGAPTEKRGLKRARIQENTAKEASEEPIDIDQPGSEQLPPPPPKKRGRPKGSKNKAQPNAKTDNLRTRATKAADPNPDEEYYDSGDICEICEFPFNHPTKIGKPKMKCKRCSKTVHIPCYLKSGCTCTWL